MSWEAEQLGAILLADGWDAKSTVTACAADWVPTRYHWLPDSLRVCLEHFDALVSGDEKAWLSTASDWSGLSDLAFSPDEWEQDSLDAADGDPILRREIIEYWDQHFPFVMSVRAGRGYLATRSDGAIVVGRAPAVEEPTVVSSDWAGFLRDATGILKRV